MTFDGTTRPPLRWHHSTTELDDFAIITYRVTAEAVARHLPEGFEPEEFAFEDGTTGALVSAVVFRDRDYHFRFFRPVSITCGQINYRTYVRAHGEPGVWFFGTSLDHPLVVVPKLLWQMPWRRSRISIAGVWDGTPAHWQMTAVDASDESHCELVEQPGPLGPLDGFLEVADVLRTLTHPTAGWYRRRDGDVGSYTIWHPVMDARRFRVEAARFTFLERLGLITADAVPHSALAQQTIHFDVHTPPRRQARPTRATRP
ncbi:DUF2071 domain-containing protein [Nocardioides speluncae]|uniref:DUF2071 domain-containing protein n=1 Tax=Nocardioides speluncae TaxID=2670337 RepID=UPI000D69B7AD|nr:DUF2071 domain-containing protein [Nocardioides speluncae]